MIMGFMMVFPVSNVFAGDAVCKLPKNCVLADSVFSIVWGKRVYMMDVTCAMPDQKIIKYIDYTVAPFFGMGLIDIPEKIKFIKGGRDELECVF